MNREIRLTEELTKAVKQACLIESDGEMTRCGVFVLRTGA
jgi:hypothetical protein